MKTRIIAALIIAFLATSCATKDSEMFKLDTNQMHIGPSDGIHLGK
jgi:hypothetical protein